MILKVGFLPSRDPNEPVYDIPRPFSRDLTAEGADRKGACYLDKTLSSDLT